MSNQTPALTSIMKKIQILGLLMVSLLSCDEISQPGEAKKGQLQFSFSNEKTNSGGRSKEGPIPAFVLLSIKDQSNTAIEENKKIPLYTFGNAYVSESLQLNVGNYKLTQFMVVDADNNVIYATPVEGSSLSQYVNDPLPINFAITENGSTLITPQVLDVTEQNTSEVFGYVSFGFEIKHRLIALNDYYNGQLIDSLAFLYTNGKLATEYHYISIDGGPQYNGEQEFTFNDFGHLERNIFSNTNDPNYDPRNDTTHYIYENGFVKKHLFRYYQDRETEFYYSEGKLSHAVMRFEVNHVMKDYAMEEYTVDSEGQISMIKWFTYNVNIKKLRLIKEYQYDSMKNPRNFFPGLYTWNYPSNQKHNIVHEKITEYYGSDLISIHEIDYVYTYNKYGLPTTRSADYPNGSYPGMDDAPFVKYLYK